LDAKEFTLFRKKLKKTQNQIAQLLGTSVKAVRSYEQGWRTVPTHVERQVLFLASRLRGVSNNRKQCWVTKNCPPERKKRCPAWEFRAGKFCWFINGTICEGVVQKNWKQKMNLCRSCDVLAPFMLSKSKG
jgi:hypothetical protein